MINNKIDMRLYNKILLARKKEVNYDIHFNSNETMGKQRKIKSVRFTSNDLNSKLICILGNKSLKGCL